MNYYMTSCVRRRENNLHRRVRNVILYMNSYYYSVTRVKYTNKDENERGREILCFFYRMLPRLCIVYCYTGGPTDGLAKYK